METARDRVGLASELAAGVQRGHHRLHARQAGRRVDIHRNPAPVVLHADRAVFTDVDADALAPACHELVDAVVDDLEDQVVEAALVCAPDVHSRSAPNGFHPLQHLNVL